MLIPVRRASARHIPDKQSLCCPGRAVGLHGLCPKRGEASKTAREPLLVRRLGLRTVQKICFAAEAADGEWRKRDYGLPAVVAGGGFCGEKYSFLTFSRFVAPGSSSCRGGVFPSAGRMCRKKRARESGSIGLRHFSSCGKRAARRFFFMKKAVFRMGKNSAPAVRFKKFSSPCRPLSPEKQDVQKKIPFQLYEERIFYEQNI